MLNTKETLKKLHKRFPMMNLDELFEIFEIRILFIHPVYQPDTAANQCQCDDKLNSEGGAFSQKGKGEQYAENRVGEGIYSNLSHRIVFQQDTPYRVCHGGDQRQVNQKGDGFDGPAG